MHRRLLILAVVLCLFPAATVAAGPIATHNNERPSGTLMNGRLELKLYAGLGTWHPESDSGASVDVQALGVEGGPLTIPGPLIRVPAGTAVDITLRNTLAVPMEFHGFYSRPASKDEGIVVEAGASRSVTFNVGSAGTYHYWGTTTHSALRDRTGIDSQLSGAFIVDDAGASKDRILLMTAWFAEPIANNPTPKDPRYVYAINGKSWPHTASMTYAVGEHVVWRVINLTETTHPMHLHGSYFDVTGAGDGLTDVAYTQDQYLKVVTQQVPIGGTARLAWIPDRDGNWLFHCHILGHISPAATIARQPLGQHQHDAEAGMRGLVVGIKVKSPTPRALTADPSARALTLTLRNIDKRFGAENGIGLALDNGNVMTPGPLLILTRGQPVAITLKNTLSEPAAIHWHGMELESYFDGVAGFSGSPGSVTPSIAPGGEFVARFTPPRAGTFMYHTHSHDEVQLAKGLFGAIVVLEPGQSYDASTDHVLMLGLNGAEVGSQGGNRDQVLLNGELGPTIQMKSGVPNRLRFINITANNDGINVFLLNQFDLGSWTLAAKDGAERTGAQRVTTPSRQAIGVGEIYDFLYTPVAGSQWIEVRRGGGAFLIQARIVPR